jgi:hypothetical protein
MPLESLVGDQRYHYNIVLSASGMPLGSPT